MESVLESYLGGVQNGVAAAVAATSAAVTQAHAGALAATAAEPDDIPRQFAGAVWVLGRRYCATQELEQIRRDVQSRLWCTYRRGFAPIGQPGYTTDRGWGCMLRCGQMLLAQALIELHLGREWFWTPECRDPTYLKIVKRFEDHRQNPYSIHTIALMGDSEDKRVGEWFGPNTVSQVLKKLVVYDDWSQLSIHVALDNMVITDEIVALCTDAADQSWRPLMLIIPLRLGLTEVNPIYIEGLKSCFRLPSNLGMIGGRPNQALYFIGYVGDEALFLDPHTTQSAAVAVGDKQTPEELEADAQFHQRYAGRIDFRTMDPSLALAFMCRTRAEFDGLCAALRADATIAGVADGGAAAAGGGGADVPRSQPLFEVAQTGYRPWVSQSYSDECAKRRASGVQEEFVNVEQPIAADTATSNQGDESDEEFEFIA